ncbi:uncharacterized protein I206_102576 [Kwoniella pini CBS 10737]|uniref:HhH-GPD domain-containing protein n=1 Tax=Kwoniella pini CBS 10737 TaxID=1296096 RepID=A0A1B9I5R9_9TREE|nr:uncharacterized protein I206_02927 [Kwoniella pini CBS 10737]OCF50869.1 hypothetical protein I206_02927 [Kwoniella pini CBS 10737]
MTSRAATKRANGMKRKYEEASNDVISSPSGNGTDSELSELDDDYLSAADEDDKPPKKNKKANANGKSSPGRLKSKAKTTKSENNLKAESIKSKAKAKNDESTKSPEKKSRKSKTDEEVKPRIKSSNPEKLLEYLLSDEALDYSNPLPEKGFGEKDWFKNSSPNNSFEKLENPIPRPKLSKKAEKSIGVGEKIKLPEGYLRYPHSNMTPFQILLSSLLLSKPLSHKMGLRTISTLLNPPFNFGKFEIFEKSDEDKFRESLLSARTQHREKTVNQLIDFAQGVKGLNGEGEENDLNGIKRAIENLNNVEKAQIRVGEMLKSLKGIGPVGVGIFLRRIQGQWEEVFPYVDQRCLDAAKSIGLIKETGNANNMAELCNNDSTLLVKLLDTLIGLDLEKKLDEVVQRFE